LPDHSIPPFGNACLSIYDSLVEQIRNALDQAGFSEVLIGLSGGIDSALVALLAAAAIGPKHVHGLLMPAAVSSEGSVLDAYALADRLGIETTMIPIEPIFTAFKEALAPTFSGQSEDVTEENLQARVRGMLLMALSNKFGWFVLNTGNYSESLMGYGTLHGDMVGSFAPLGQLLKTQVYELARYINTTVWRAGVEPPISEAILTKEPSAELAPGQLDRDALGPYEEIDPVLYGHFVQGKSAEQLVEEGFPHELVQRVLVQAARAAFKLRFEPPAAQLPSQAQQSLLSDEEGGGPSLTTDAASDFSISQVAPEELPADVRALLYGELYRDYGVAPDQEWLNAADGGCFFVARDQSSRLCGAGRLMPRSESADNHGLQIRQLVSAPEMRGRGVGTAIMDALEAAVTTQGIPCVWLKARQQAWGFYEKRGYHFEGSEFTAGECMQDNGLFISHLTGIPHRIMAKSL